MGGTVAVGGFELVAHLPVGRQRQALLRDRWATDVAAQALEFIALMSFASHRRAERSLHD